VTPSNESLSDQELWKDRLDKKAISVLAAEIARFYSSFKTKAFVEAVWSDNFDQRELKDRIHTIATHLKAFMPDDYRTTVGILRKVAPHANGFANWAIMTYIERFGLDDFDTSVAAMEALTQYSTAEFAIRPYMNRYTEHMLPVLHQWATDANEHVRRLAAEGSRPRGVWVAHIPAFREDPRPVIELLEKLKADDSLYVRKAVANNLNDISKDHPDLVIKTALRWKKTDHVHTNWIIKHACRTLIKAGHPEAFPLFDFSYPPKVRVTSLKTTPNRVKIGGELTFAFTVTSTHAKPQKLAVDYAVHYVKADGRTTKKVFKLSEKTIAPKESMELKSKRSFKNFSTRTHHPGKHTIEIIVNGVKKASADFAVTS
jgi:3-methyladenine DNA glycosylase AlkC